jgi:hypothetical protein
MGIWGGVASIGAGGGVASMVTGGRDQRWDLTWRLRGLGVKSIQGNDSDSLHTKYTQVQNNIYIYIYIYI